MKEILKWVLAVGFCWGWLFTLNYSYTLPSDYNQKLSAEESARIDKQTKEWARQLHEKETVINIDGSIGFINE